MNTNKQASTPALVGDRLYNVSDTCATLGVGPTKVWELIKNGHLDVVRLGRRTTRVKGSSIAALIAGGA